MQSCNARDLNSFGQSTFYVTIIVFNDVIVHDQQDTITFHIS